MCLSRWFFDSFDLRVCRRVSHGTSNLYSHSERRKISCQHWRRLPIWKTRGWEVLERERSYDHHRLGLSKESNEILWSNVTNEQCRKEFEPPFHKQIDPIWITMQTDRQVRPEEFVWLGARMVSEIRINVLIRLDFDLHFTSILVGVVPVICKCRSGKGWRGPRSFCTATKVGQQSMKKMVSATLTILIHSDIDTSS